MDFWISLLLTHQSQICDPIRWSDLETYLASIGPEFVFVWYTIKSLLYKNNPFLQTIWILDFPTVRFILIPSHSDHHNINKTLLEMNREWCTVCGIWQITCDHLSSFFQTWDFHPWSRSAMMTVNQWQSTSIQWESHLILTILLHPSTPLLRSSLQVSLSSNNIFRFFNLWHYLPYSNSLEVIRIHSVKYMTIKLIILYPIDFLDM